MVKNDRKLFILSAILVVICTLSLVFLAIYFENNPNRKYGKHYVQLESTYVDRDILYFIPNVENVVVYEKGSHDLLTTDSKHFVYYKNDDGKVNEKYVVLNNSKVKIYVVGLRYYVKVSDIKSVKLGVGSVVDLWQ